MTAEINSILQLQPTDTFRSGVLVHLNNLIARIIFAIKEFFTGGWAAHDLEAFAKDYYPRVRGKIILLEQKLTHHLDEERSFLELSELLKEEAKISNSSWGSTLKKSSPEFAHFHQTLHEMQKMAQKSELFDQWIHQEKIAARWIRATDVERYFAAYFNLDQVPYRFDEIPAGAVMLTDPAAYLQTLELNNNQHLLMSIFVKIKAFITRFFSGMLYTHAELSLGHGKAFEMDKKKKGGAWIHGQGLIHHYRQGKVFYGTIMIPKKDEMLRAYNERFPDARLDSFEELMARIDAEACAGAPKIVDINPWDLFQTALPIERKPDYDCTKAWRPGENKFSCSATISALYSKFGIDIGKEFDKIDKNITPGDFFASRFFTPLYVVRSES